MIGHTGHIPACVNPKIANNDNMFIITSRLYLLRNKALHGVISLHLQTNNLPTLTRFQRRITNSLHRHTVLLYHRPWSSKQQRISIRIQFIGECRLESLRKGMLPLWSMYSDRIGEFAGSFGLVFDGGEALRAKDFLSLVVVVVGASAEGECNDGS